MDTSRPILVTGAAGFVGSNLVKKLVSDGRAVAALVRETTDLRRLDNIRSKIDVVYADIEKREELKKKMKEMNPSGIFHLAVSNMMSGVAAPPDEVIRANVLGTVNLIDAANEVDYDFFIQTGSFLEYGIKQRPVQETDCGDPLELQSITKLAATLYAAKTAKAQKKPIVTFRVFTPYGPGIQKGRLVYEVISRALKGEDIALTDPEVSRDFIYVEDLAELLIKGSEKARIYSGEIFNAGSGTATTLKELADIVLEMTGSKSEAKWGKPLVAYDAKLWQADMAKTFSSFSWRPKHGIKDGLKLTVEWLKNI